MRTGYRRKDENVFKDFGEFWFFTKHLTNKQIQGILRTLSKSQRSKLKDSYKEGGWGDLMIRNSIDSILDDIKEDYGCDMLHLRMLTQTGKRIYVNREFWDSVQFRFRGFKQYHLHYVFGGFRHVESESPDEYLLVME